MSGLFGQDEHVQAVATQEIGTFPNLVDKEARNAVTPRRVVAPEERIQGMRGTLRKMLGGDPDYINVTISYRKRGETSWTTAQTVNGVGTAVRKKF